MSVTVLETLSSEDLTLWREYAGMLEGVVNSGDKLDMTVQEIRDFYIRYWEFVSEILERYGIDDDEAEQAKISVFTGQIYVGEE